MSSPSQTGSWLKDQRDPAARALYTVRRHVEAETSADTDAICATVADNVFFAVPTRTREGQQLSDGEILTDPGAVRNYYSRRSDSYVVMASSQLKSIASGWYVFNESAASLRGTGRIGDVDATDRDFVVHSAILFPTAEDGIRGEICITRHPFADVAAGRIEPVLEDSSSPAAAMEQAALLDRAFECFCQPDATPFESLLTTRHALAIRLDDSRGAPEIHSARYRTKAAIAFNHLFGESREIAMVSRLVSSWYLFAEYAIALESGGLRHLALVHSVDEGRLSSSFGYGWEESATLRP